MFSNEKHITLGPNLFLEEAKYVFYFFYYFQWSLCDT